MDKRLFVFFLVANAACMTAQTIWHQQDSITFPHSEKVSFMEEYTAISVLKNDDTSTSSMLWGIKTNDSLVSAVLTDGIYLPSLGVIPYRKPRDFSHWSIYAYHAGIRMDSTRSYELHLDSMTEFVFFPRALTRVESGAWQSYLAMKYGITLDYAPYISYRGDTLWSTKMDEEFYHRIVAIGNDSLHHWQSSFSESKEGASLQLSTEQPLDESNYILLGDNDAEESWSLQANGRSRLLRTWRLRRHTTTNQMVSLVWYPHVHITQPDSVALLTIDDWGEPTASVRPDSIVGDSAYWFTYLVQEPTTMISFSTHEGTLISTETPDVIYNASTGTIAISSLDPNKVYSYALYTSLGYLLCRPAPSRPDNINAGHLPVGVYSIEVFDNTTMVANLPIIVH